MDVAVTVVIVVVVVDVSSIANVAPVWKDFSLSGLLLAV